MVPWAWGRHKCLAESTWLEGVWLLEPPLLQLPQTKMMNKVIKVLQARSFYYKADWLFSTKSAIQSLNQKKAFNK